MITHGSRSCDRWSWHHYVCRNSSAVVVAYGVAPHVSESHLLEAFSGFGPVEKAFTIPVYGVGVVQFRNTSSAASCVENGQGMVISGMPVRIEWGYTAAQNPLFRSSPVSGSAVPTRPRLFQLGDGVSCDLLPIVWLLSRERAAAHHGANFVMSM